MYKRISRALRLSASTSCHSFSTSSSSAFFFGRPAPPDATTLLRDLADARRAERLDLVTKVYPALVAAIPGEPSSLPHSVHSTLTSVMSFVAQTNRFPLLLKMFNDLPKFGFRPSATDHRILLQGLMNEGEHERALDWLASMEKTYGLTPRTREWNVVLEGYKSKKNIEGLEKVLALMKLRGVALDVRSFNTLISAAFQGHNFDEARRLRSEMEAQGIATDAWTDTILLSGFLEAGELASASSIRKRLEPLVERWLLDGASESYDVAVVNVFIKYECVTAGLDAGIALAAKFSDAGLPCDMWTINSLVKFRVGKGLKSAAQGVKFLERLQTVTGMTADSRAWTLVQNSLLAGSGGLNEALEVHQEARDRSVRVDSQMVQPLLSHLLLPSPTAQSFAIAKSLYEDLATSSRSFHSAPDLSVYTTLLRACADYSSPDLEFSRSLLADMQQRGIRLEPGSVTWHIVAHIRVARDFDEAFQAYDTIRGLHVTSLNTASYNTVLAAFTSLPFASTSSESSTAFIQEFLSDMRRSKNPPDAATYSLLLSYYSASGSTSASSVAHIHSLVKVDSNLDPDTALLNALMNAYSHVKAFNAALGVWDSMRANRATSRSGLVDETSVSIVFDTLGWLGRQNGLKRARDLWAALKQEHFPLNLKNYESWVECLCRMDELDAAERVVFEEMGRDEPVEATASTLKVLLKFVRKSRGREKSDELWRRAEKERPELRRSMLELPERLRPVVNV